MLGIVRVGPDPNICFCSQLHKLGYSNPDSWTLLRHNF